MKKRVIFGIFVAVAVLASAACLIPIYLPESGTYPPQNEFHRVIALDPGSTISIENAVGDIEIRGWDKNEAEITAQDEWGRTYGRRAWIYGRDSSGPDVEVDKIENFLKIKTRISGREDTIRPVHYVLNVPRSVNLRDVRTRQGDIRIADLYGNVHVDVEEGDIIVENFSGSLDIFLGSGAVEAELLDMRADDEVKITVKEGPVTLFLQPEANVRLEATAANGTISGDFDLGQPLPAKKVKAQIGKPDAASVSISALNGIIRLTKIK